MRPCHVASPSHGGLLTGVFWGLVMTGGFAASVALAFLLLRSL